LNTSNTGSATTTLTVSSGGDALVINSLGNALKTVNPTGGPSIRAEGVSLGVTGVATGTSGTGVRGEATGGFGLSGVATAGIGLTGSSSTNVGVFGSVDTPGATGSIGLVGRSGAGTGLVGQTTTVTAGRFDGPVNVNGDFTATGMKSAAVKLSDGNLYRMYCQEAPEPWFEDFGEARLSGGSVKVDLDDGFAQTIDLTRPYQVFLTSYSSSVAGLACVSRDENGFVVAGQGDGGFGYRVVGHRRDIKASRLERVTPNEGRLDRPLTLPNNIPSATPRSNGVPTTSPQAPQAPRMDPRTRAD